jgi:branched-chain amino acid transport system ATP-binding protein
MLVAEGLVGGYGGADILKGVSMRLDAREIVVIIGPNGAGKSTVMKAVFGLVALREGRITFDGQDIARLPTEQRVRRGLA